LGTSRPFGDFKTLGIRLASMPYAERRWQAMKLETLKFGLLIADLLLLSVNIALELNNKRNGK
jgi:hypothetical protein